MENAFGFISAIWQVFQTKLYLPLPAAEKIVLAACALINSLRYHKRSVGDATTAMEPQRKQNLSNIGKFGESSVRDQFCHYFNNEGFVDRQDDMI